MSERDQLINAYYRALAFGMGEDEILYKGFNYKYDDKTKRLVCLGFYNLEDKQIVVPDIFDSLYIEGGVITNKYESLEYIDLGKIKYFENVLRLNTNIKVFKGNSLIGRIDPGFCAFSRIQECELNSIECLSGNYNFYCCSQLTKLSFKQVKLLKMFSIVQCRELKELNVARETEFESNAIMECSKLKLINMDGCDMPVDMVC